MARASPPLPSAGPVAPGATERYTEQQLVEILKRAAERQEGLVGESDGRFSLEEIQQIASEVGIAPAHVATAAAEISSLSPRTSGFLGAPTTFRFERWIDGEVPRSTIGALFEIAQRETGLEGVVSEALDTIEWRGRDTVDKTVVSVTVRDGRTKIAVVLTRIDAAALTVTGASIAGIGTAVAIGAPLVATAAAAGGAFAVTAAVLATLGWSGGGTWLATRAFWRRLARKWPRSAAALGAQLVDAAQRAIAAARKDSE